MANKILIIDDDPDTLRLLGILLGRMGHRTIAAPNGKQGLKMALEEQPDLVVLDIMMPEMDGYDVARRLRHNPETAKIPILMFTARSQTQDKVTGYDAGADLFLVKPIHPVELNAHVKVLLAGRQAAPSAPKPKSYVTGIAAAKGGQGVSTIALNLGIVYQRNLKTEVIAAELKPGQGSWAAELGIAESAGLVELLHAGPVEITTAMVEKQLIRTNYGIRLLLASTNPSDADCAAALAQFEAVIEQLSRLAPVIILDIGTSFHPAFQGLTGLCDEIILVTEPQPIEVKRTRALIDQLRGESFGKKKQLTVVTVNCRSTEVSLTLAQVEEMLGQRVVQEFPPAVQLAHMAGIRSEPMCVLQPEGEISRRFALLAKFISAHTA
jgi:CheY-like chemotaxis protein